MEKNEMKIMAEAMNKLAYFMYNFPSDFIQKCWADDPNLAAHFDKKFTACYEASGSDGAVLSFIGELSVNNMEKLYRWIIENYHDERKIYRD